MVNIRVWKHSKASDCTANGSEAKSLNSTWSSYIFHKSRALYTDPDWRTHLNQNTSANSTPLRSIHHTGIFQNTVIPFSTFAWGSQENNYAGSNWSLHQDATIDGMSCSHNFFHTPTSLTEWNKMCSPTLEWIDSRPNRLEAERK